MLLKETALEVRQLFFVFTPRKRYSANELVLLKYFTPNSIQMPTVVTV
jgi:hypothetical protein